jgi:transposase
MISHSPIDARVQKALEGIRAAEWEQVPASVESLLEVILEVFQENAEKIRQLEERAEKLARENQQLWEQLRRNSGNSSQPPSSDFGQKEKPKSQRKKSERNRGGQPGHAGHQRNLVPVEQCQKVIDHYPKCCKKCGEKLQGQDPDPYRHQVVEIPPVQPEVEEHRLHELACAHCGEKTRAGLPEGVSLSGYGARVKAVVALLGGVYRASQRMTASAMEDLFGIEMSLGTVNQLRQQMSQALAEPVEEAHQYIQEQRIVHADETGFRQGNADGNNPGGKKAWLWVAVTSLVTVFHVTLSRGQESARRLLGEAFAGILISDRWNGYNWIRTVRRQFCWAHLKREFQKIAERDGASRTLGEALLEAEEKLFSLWHRVRDGTLSRRQFKRQVKEIRRQVQWLLSAGADYCLKKGDKSLRAKTARTCRELLKMEEALWLFVEQEGVEPTNNAAERAIRPAVLWRHVSFGTESESGSQFVARMLTVAATLRSQQRNILDFLCQATNTYRQGVASPSLLPITIAPEGALAA